MRASDLVSIYVVDRVEGAIAVLVADADGLTVDVDAAALPRRCAVEGAVLRVPFDAGSAPAWGRARRDVAEEARRRADAAARLERLRAADPGGDITL